MQQLLLELEPLTYAARSRRMVELGRLAANGDDAAAVAMLAALRADGGFERRLALQAAWGSRDQRVPAGALSDPSRLAAGRARRLAAVLCDGPQVLGAALAMARSDRRRFIEQLYRRRRGAEIDGILQALAGRADPDFGRLLPFGSGAFVGRSLAAGGVPARLDWPALAVAHPAVAAAWLERSLAADGPLDRALRFRLATALPALSQQAPDRALGLLRQVAARLPLGSLPLGVLLLQRPDGLAALCLAEAEHLPVSFEPVARRLEPARLLGLLERFGSLGPAPRSPARWLRRLPMAQREAAHALANRGWRDRDGAIDRATLMLLPAPLRHAEVRRVLALPALASRPAQRLGYAGLLPWPEARHHLDRFLGDPEPELRGIALRGLCACLRFERDQVAAMLGLLAARRNEPDPVRGQFLLGLAELPQSVWLEAHLDALGLLVRQALDAPDLSPSTTAQVERLLVGLLPRLPGFAGSWLATLARERGALTVPPLQDRLSPGDVGRLAGHLMPVLEDWYDRERQAQILTFAGRLGLRLQAWTSLATLIERILRATTSLQVAAAGLTLLARHREDRLALLVPSLLAEDPSWIRLEVVQRYLHRHRQDLLTRFLGRDGHKGRFATGETYLVLPFRQGFHRWTPAQQRLFEGAALGLVTDAAGGIPAALRAIRQIAALPDTTPTALARLAAADAARPALRDAALRGLGRRDAGDGLPLLLEALGDGRARVAAYALRRSVLAMPVAEALALLHRVPMRQVTVAKEVLRLVGELPGREAHAWLMAKEAEDRQGGLHRDLRIALLRALWSHLDREPSWAAMQRAAASADPVVAAAVARIPAAMLPPETGGKLAGLLARLLEHADPRVRGEALQGCAAAALADHREMLLPPLQRLLGSSLPEERRLAAEAILARGLAEHAGAAAAAVRANRRAVASLGVALQGWAGQAREGRAATVQAVLAAWAPDPMLAGRCAGLGTATLPPEPLAAFLHDAVGGLHADALALGLAGLGAPPARPPGALEAIEAMLSAEADPALRRLALAALTQQASGVGWSDDRLARLEGFRRDPAALVAEAAQFTFPPGEDDAVRAASLPPAIAPRAARLTGVLRWIGRRSRS